MDFFCAVVVQSLLMTERWLLLVYRRVDPTTVVRIYSRPLNTLAFLSGCAEVFIYSDIKRHGRYSNSYEAQNCGTSQFVSMCSLHFTSLGPSVFVLLTSCLFSTCLIGM